MSDNMMLDLFGGELPQEEEADEFRYEVLDPEDADFVREQEYQVRDHWTRAASEILSAGEKLLLVQERLKDANKGKHGSFIGWLRKAGLSIDNAYFAMKAFSRFGDNKNFGIRNFSNAALKELAYASDEVVDQVLRGEVLSTSTAIRKAEKAQREAEEALKRARAAEARASADAQATQRQLLLIKEAAEDEINALTEQNASLKGQLTTLAAPQIEIREVTKEVLPQSVINNLEALQRQLSEKEEEKKKALQTLQDELQREIKRVNVDLETQKKVISPEAKKKIEDLQKQLDKMKEEQARLQRDRNQQEVHIKKLNEDINAVIRKREFAENADRIRQNWRAMNSEVHSCLMRMLGQWPTPIDVQTFDADDWAYVEHLQSTLRRVLEECSNLRHSGEIVEDHNSSQSLIALNGYVVESEMSNTD